LYETKTKFSEDMHVRQTSCVTQLAKKQVQNIVLETVRGECTENVRFANAIA